MPSTPRQQAELSDRWRKLPDRCEDDEERGFFCHGGAEVSFRTANHITLRIDSINGEATS